MGLEMVEISLETEDRFGIELPHHRVGECDTYGDFLDLVADVANQTNTAHSKSEIDDFLRNLLISDYSIKAEHITRDAKLYGPNLNLG